MTIKISILGLDKIGSSIGLALGKYNEEFHRTGFDPNKLKRKILTVKDSLDTRKKDIESCVKEADVVFLNLPPEMIKQSLHSMKNHVHSETVIVCISPAKVIINSWVNEILGNSVHFIGMEFLLPPHLMKEFDIANNVASSSLFENNLAAIAIPPDTGEDVLKLATGLCSRLGAIPYFCDMLEMDGMVSTTRILPQLVSSALLNATLNSPGWPETTKSTGTEYALAVSGIADNEENNGVSHSSILVKEHVIRGLDSFISSLLELKATIAEEDTEQLDELLEQARIGRLQWWRKRTTRQPESNNKTSVSMPPKGQYWKQLIGLSGRKPRYPGTDKKDKS